MQLFDTHAHLLDERFNEDRESLLAALPGKGLARVLEACTGYGDVPGMLALIARWPYIYGSVGTHPHDAKGFTEAHLAEYRRLAAHEKIVAIGEIGLDYHYDFSPRGEQAACFEAQLALAAEAGLPVILHMREATEDMLAILRAHRGGLSGVMHCFSGSYETAKICLDMGLYIAFGGALTFKNAHKSIETAAKLPQERLLIETDCPYMTPEPYRGKRNDPTLVRLVCERLAEIRGLSAARMAELTLQNGLALFGKMKG